MDNRYVIKNVDAYEMKLLYINNIEYVPLFNQEIIDILLIKCNSNDEYQEILKRIGR